MPRIAITKSSFTPIPEGEHIFRIYEVIYDEVFGKMEVKMVEAGGKTHTERFSLKNANDEPIPGAMTAFSILAKNAMNNFDMDDVDPMDLVGRYIKAVVEHNVVPNRNDPTKTVTFTRLGNKYPADGFDREATERAKTLGTTPKEEQVVEATPAPAKGLDIDALLG